MKNGAKYFQWSVVLIIAILLFLFLRRCGNEGSSKHTTDTISIKADTVYVHVKADTIYVPAPYKVEVPYKDFVYIPKMVRQPIDSAAILKDYLSTRYYSEVIPNEYGEITIDDTVYTNRITGRRVRTNIKVPEITKTITLRQPQRVVGYFGMGLTGNPNTPIYGTMADFSLKFKNDKIYSIGAILTKNELYYSFGFRLPIHLRKK